MREPYRHGALTFRTIRDLPHRSSTSPTFLLVHGIGMSHRYLSRLHGALGAKATTVSLDLPGHGGLPKPGLDVDVPLMARGIAGAIESLDVGPVVVIGHSMGAQWVAELAHQRPDLVKAVVLIGPVVDSRRRTLPAQMAALARDTFGESARVNGIVATDYFRCGVPWYLAQARHMLRYAIEDTLEQLTAPVLIIRGARDPIAGSEWCRQLGDRAAGSRLVEIPRHHHVVQESAPREVAAAIQSFVTDLAPAPSEPRP
ncbi:alpha/beta fold hydrolase [Demequina sp. SO4-13]|uniref:alpha/beta fold hydrolase n=1 Tax=Demequina sp. SO4-13 TaxID=3401027 RepID=UPI003AF83E6C